MCSFKMDFLYKSALKRYMKDFQILPNSKEAEEVREKMKLITKNPDSRRDSEYFLAALAGISIKIEKEKTKKEELLDEGTAWLSFPSQAFAARYLFRDFRAVNIIGAKEVFREGLKKYCS
jgi:hypothetical protein